MKTPPRPEIRHAARVLLLDPEGRVLLLRGSDPVDPRAGTWWMTPGGGIEHGEDAAAAAAREAMEETGCDVRGRLTGPVHDRRTVFAWNRRIFDQREVYFVAHVDAFAPTSDGWTELEISSISEQRWWTAAEIRATDETVYPEDLASLVEAHR